MHGTNGRAHGPQQMPPVVNQFTLGTDPHGKPLLVMQQITQSAFNVVDMLRNLKRGFPEQWMLVHLEVDTPPEGLILPD